MKVGFSTFVCPDWGLDEIIAAAVKHRYHGVELRIGAGHKHGVELDSPVGVRIDARQKLTDAKIELCCLASGLQMIHEEAVSQLHGCLELAVDMGCPAIRVLGGPLTDPSVMPYAIDKVTQNLEDAAGLADQAGVELWVETCDLFHQALDAAEAVRRVGHPAVGLCYDPMHPYRYGERIKDTLLAINGLVRHTHFHDAVSSREHVVVTPMGQGDLPMDQIYQALRGMGYQGYLCGLWYHQQYGDSPDESLGAYQCDLTRLISRQHRPSIRRR